MEADKKYKAYKANYDATIGDKKRLEAELNRLKGQFGDLDSKLKSREALEGAVSGYKEVVEAATKSMQSMTGDMN